MVGIVERLTEAQLRGLVEKVGISFVGLERDLKGVCNKVQKQWLMVDEHGKGDRGESPIERWLWRGKEGTKRGGQRRG